MKIKTVEYRRLFHIPDFQNETIGFVADVEKNTPQGAISKLYDMVISVNHTVNKLREIAGELTILNSVGTCYCSSIEYRERTIEHIRQKIDKQEKQKKDGSDIIITCLKSDLEHELDELKKLKSREKELSVQYQQINTDFKNGILLENTLFLGVGDQR